MDKLVELAKADMTLFEKIQLYIEELLENLRASYVGLKPDSKEGRLVSKWTDCIDELHSLWEDAAIAAIGNSQHGSTKTKNTTSEGDVKFADRPFAEQVDAVLSGEDTISTHLRISEHTPQILLDLGLSDKAMLITSTHTKTAVGKKVRNKNTHYVSKGVLKKLPQLIEKPAIVMESTTQGSIVMFVNAVDINKDPVICAIKVDGRGFYNSVEIESNVVTSVYGKDTNPIGFIEKAVNDNRLLYWDKKMSQELFDIPRLQLPNNIYNFDSNVIIRKITRKVNKNSDRDTEYLTAVNNDMETAQRLVDEAARKAGYNSPLLYHGTNSFGFTEFDLDKMDDNISIFLTNNEKIATSYSSVFGKRNISDINNSRIYELSGEQIVKELSLSENGLENSINQGKKNYQFFDTQKQNEFTLKVKADIDAFVSVVENKIKLYADRLSKDVDDNDYRRHNQLVELLNHLKNYDYSELYLSIWAFANYTNVFKDEDSVYDLIKNIHILDKFNELNDVEEKVVIESSEKDLIEVVSVERAREMLINKRNRGNYSLYAKLGKSLVIECNGRNWEYIQNWGDYAFKKLEDVEITKNGNKFRIIDKATQKDITDNMLADTNGVFQFGFDEANDALLLKNVHFSNTREVAEWASQNGYNSIIFKNILDIGGYGTLDDEQVVSDVYVLFNPNDVKSADPVTYDDNGQVILLSERFDSEKKDIRYQPHDYSYSALTSKPDMKLTIVGGAVPTNRADVIAQAKKNAAKVGKFNTKDGSVSVCVDDIDTDVIVTTRSLVHGLDRRLPVQAPVLVKIGEVLKGAIRINELKPRAENVDSTYVLIGAAQSQDGHLYIASFVVNKYSNEINEIDVLYSANAKKEPAAFLPKFTADAATPTDSKISIANLLDYVNKYFPDILPESVFAHYGHKIRPEGVIGKSALYQTRDPEVMAAYEKVNAQLIKENKKLSADVEDLKELLKLQKTVTKRFVRTILETGKLDAEMIEGIEQEINTCNISHKKAATLLGYSFFDICLTIWIFSWFLLGISQPT